MLIPKRPHPLLDALLAEKKLPHDRALAERLSVDAASLSKVRAGRPVSDHIRVAVLRKFNWSIRRVDELAPPAP